MNEIAAKVRKAESVTEGLSLPRSIGADTGYAKNAARSLSGAENAGAARILRLRVGRIDSGGFL